VDPALAHKKPGQSLTGMAIKNQLAKESNQQEQVSQRIVHIKTK